MAVDTETNNAGVKMRVVSVRDQLIEWDNGADWVFHDLLTHTLDVDFEQVLRSAFSLEVLSVFLGCSLLWNPDVWRERK
jgi:hypothetical protein